MLQPPTLNNTDNKDPNSVMGWKIPHRSPCYPWELFYVKYLKPWRPRFGGMLRGHPVPSEAVFSLDFTPDLMDIDDPELRQLVDKHIDRHIRNPNSMSGLTNSFGQFPTANSVEGRSFNDRKESAQNAYAVSGNIHGGACEGSRPKAQVPLVNIGWFLRFENWELW